MEREKEKLQETNKTSCNTNGWMAVEKETEMCVKQTAKM